MTRLFLMAAATAVLLQASAFAFDFQSKKQDLYDTQDWAENLSAELDALAEGTFVVAEEKELSAKELKELVAEAKPLLKKELSGVVGEMKTILADAKKEKVAAESALKELRKAITASKDIAEKEKKGIFENVEKLEKTLEKQTKAPLVRIGSYITSGEAELKEAEANLAKVEKVLAAADPDIIEAAVGFAKLEANIDAFKIYSKGFTARTVGIVTATETVKQTAKVLEELIKLGPPKFEKKNFRNFREFDQLPEKIY